MLPRAPSVVRIRNVMLIISITFASFFIYWSFLYVFIHKLGYHNSEYKTHRWLRVTQGFCAIFEISLASKSLCSQQNQVTPKPTTSNTLQQLTRIPVQPIQPGYQYPPGVQPEGGITSITQQQPSAPPYSGELSCSSDPTTNPETTNPVISTNSLTNQNSLTQQKQINKQIRKFVLTGKKKLWKFGFVGLVWSTLIL